MNQSLVTAQEAENPFSRQAVQAGMPVGANVGAVAIEQERAIAEAQGQLILAKRFPRDLIAAHNELMAACKSKAFAEVAFYSVPNRGTGPSIRFAEEVARCYGNFEYGHRELSRDSNKSEVEVYAWDKEKNNYSRRQLTVLHVVDTKHGPKACRDQSDIDNLIANKASKQVRGRILGLMPKWLVEDAIQECKKTIAGVNDEPIEARVRKMTQAFAKYGVTTEHLERYLGHKLDEVLIDELVDMTGIYNALREGAKPSEYFDAKELAPAGNSTFANLSQQAAAAPAEAPANDNVKAEATQQTPARKPRRQQAAEAAPAAQQEPVATAEPEAQQQAEPEQVQQAEPAAEPAEAAGGDLF